MSTYTAVTRADQGAGRDGRIHPPNDNARIAINLVIPRRTQKGAESDGDQQQQLARHGGDGSNAERVLSLDIRDMRAAAGEAQASQAVGKPGYCGPIIVLPLGRCAIGQG